MTEDSYYVWADPTTYSYGRELYGVVNKCSVAKEIALKNGLSWQGEECITTDQIPEPEYSKMLESIVLQIELVGQQFDGDKYFEADGRDNGIESGIISAEYIAYQTGLKSDISQAQIFYADTTSNQIYPSPLTKIFPWWHND